MPHSPPRLCPGCGAQVHGRCPTCSPDRRRFTDQQRGSSSSRGYGHYWRTVIRPAFLREHPLCVLCGELAEVPDHWPRTRRQLLDDQVADPDACEHLRPLCTSCHNRYGEKTRPTRG